MKENSQKIEKSSQGSKKILFFVVGIIFLLIIGISVVIFVAVEKNDGIKGSRFLPDYEIKISNKEKEFYIADISCRISSFGGHIIDISFDNYGKDNITEKELSIFEINGRNQLSNTWLNPENHTFIQSEGYMQTTRDISPSENFSLKIGLVGGEVFETEISGKELFDKGICNDDYNFFIDLSTIP
jgi:hypothetical protein